MTKGQFRVSPFRAVIDDSGERDGWWIRAEPDGTELFIGGHELAKMRRLIQKVEKYEAKRPSRKR